jgi:mitochondrial protein MBA1
MTWKLLDRSQDLSSKLPWLNTGKLSARIVSNRMGHLPISGASDRKTPSAVRQVVLRIASRQVLTVEREIDGKGKGSKAEKLAKLAWRPEGANEQAEDEFDWAIERHPKDVVEYVVMQRRMLRGNEEDWKVWGFTEPTTMESMREAERFEKESRAYSASQLGIA